MSTRAFLFALAITIAAWSNVFAQPAGETDREAAVKAAAEEVKALEEALSREPENPELYSKLGDALLAAGDNERAGKVFRRYVDLRPQDCRSHAGMSRAYLAQGLADHAVRSGEEARKLCPGEPATLIDLAKAYSKGPYAIEAIECYRRAIELDPNRLDTYEYLGQLCFERSLYPEAIAVYEAALLRPGLIETSSLVHTSNARLATLYLWSGSTNLAIPHLERAVRGKSLSAADIGQIEDALASDPNCRASVRMILAEEWERVGDLPRARTAYEKAAECPGEEAKRAKEALDRLNRAANPTGG
jgi:tetratricopeptide (TPR) repeat protein